MKIYIYRHGQTLYNDKGIVQGRGVDSSLNEKGKAQAEAFFEQYKTIPFDLVITSTLKRTIETVAPFDVQNISTERKEEIEEISWGEWEGKAANKGMHSAYIQLLDKWSEGNYDARLAGSDSANDMGKRLSTFVDYLRTLEHENILVCTHGGCLAFLMAILQKQPLSAMTQYKHHNTGLCLFEYHKEKDEFELLLRDDTSHL